ncbi:ectoine/hydroxyectoine ABC transporter substrate-binding protein EhuB [Desulfosporosinus sp.]|uniref:ectoine/hydroxyectoine ABC transporter substrate-binding protein EhuB n=1 Tax=Desulfosporosinus sp. TaxID=157907 RepID=UPI000E8BB251|nr:ectoine/hydroxyectoine ABC transporter substrate-binding protein EhuB [Desulfosporosinus sp.]MBC2724680.1 ectoine/hydroxyectoine ABC transporter substrate-binding protein EhuB [Desulfosporosinus sp.]MBC2725473.1 ectoine/hydroxyectoine ABC transporter substrate-binding protein EhuB [Desulfosporosinus sp.]HBV88858.1 ectoine/hydroxyectoine ABC transporter substrate-binding protein EhuB [Desulfosporosinus sp.]
MKRFKLFLAATLTLSLLALAGCGAAETKNDAKSTLETAKERGYVVVGFANEKPYAYQTPDGKLTGEAVEVARTILKNMGIEEMKGELTEFASLIPGLNAKRFDMITAGMFINPDRAKEVDFANPEYSIGEGIAVKKGNPLNLHSYKDIAANPKAIIAVPGGAIEYDYLLKSGVPLKQIMTVPDMPAALSALQSGRADALTATGPSVQATLETANNPDLERVMDFEQPVIDGKEVRGYGATAFRKEDKDFREAFNSELQKLKESGDLLKIISPFGFTEQELPGDKTAAELSK